MPTTSSDRFVEDGIVRLEGEYADPPRPSREFGAQRNKMRASSRSRYRIRQAEGEVSLHHERIWISSCPTTLPDLNSADSVGFKSHHQLAAPPVISSHGHDVCLALDNSNDRIAATGKGVDPLRSCIHVGPICSR